MKLSKAGNSDLGSKLSDLISCTQVGIDQMNFMQYISTFHASVLEHNLRSHDWPVCRC